MIYIIFESHSTSLDNEKNIASGWSDPNLSDLGLKQAKDLGRRYNNNEIEAIFCSDLKRSYRTAEIAFGKKYLIIKDSRLREINYGNLNSSPNQSIKSIKQKHVNIPFPNGECYEQTTEKIKSFLSDLHKGYNGKTIMIVGHRATQYGLEFLINKIPLKKVIMAPWQWQPGWKYILK